MLPKYVMQNLTAKERHTYTFDVVVLVQNTPRTVTSTPMPSIKRDGCGTHTEDNKMPACEEYKLIRIRMDDFALQMRNQSGERSRARASTSSSSLSSLSSVACGCCGSCVSGCLVCSTICACGFWIWIVPGWIYR